MSRCCHGTRPLPSRMLLPAASTVAFLAAVCTVQAQDLCGDIGTLIEQSRSGFAEIADEPTGDAGEYDATLVLAGASYCRVARKSAGTWYHCGWAFPHRAEPAYDTFDELVERMDACIGEQATMHDDRSVNHPDFYASRRYDMARARVTLSVKDKAALGNTFVFVRVQGPDGG